MEFVSQLFVLFLAYHTLQYYIVFHPPSLIRDLYVSTETYRQLGVGGVVNFGKGVKYRPFLAQKIQKIFYIFLNEFYSSIWFIIGQWRKRGLLIERGNYPILQKLWALVATACAVGIEG